MRLLISEVASARVDTIKVGLRILRESSRFSSNPSACDWINKTPKAASSKTQTPTIYRPPLKSDHDEPPRAEQLITMIEVEQDRADKLNPGYCASCDVMASALIDWSMQSDILRRFCTTGAGIVKGLAFFSGSF